MGKAELTAPWGGRGVEGGEGEAGGSCFKRREAGRGEARRDLQWERWRLSALRMSGRG